MKRLTTLFAAVMMVAMSFAAVEYVLPEGAVTNDYGWTSKADMFAAFMTDAGATNFGTLESYMQLEDPLGGTTGICTPLENVTPAFAMETKWMWLKQYIVDVTTEQIATNPSPMPTALAVTDANSAAWRYAVGAFFCSTQRGSWPVSADFAVAGTFGAFQPTWKHGFDNPTEVAEGETWTLNAPYLEGETFRGWFDNEAGSGTPITEITSATTGELYAVFGEYIPSIKEVREEVEAGTKTKIHGIVTYVGGKNVYIADGGVGILVYLNGDDYYDKLDGWKDLKVSDNIVVEGTYKLDNTFPRLEDNTLISAVAGTKVAVVGKTLADVVANAHNLYGTPVKVEGVKISKYDNYGNVYVTDGTNEIEGYYMTPDQTSFPVGAKVTITAVVANYKENVQFVGNTEDIVAAAAALIDETEYPVRGAEADFAGYTLENKWIIANTYDNFSENAPGPTDNVRGMVVKDGMMYFINNEGGYANGKPKGVGKLTVVNAENGFMLEPIVLKDDIHMFETQDEEGKWSVCATLAYNDLKKDNAGNLLIGGCISGGNRFQIYKVDEKTGATTVVIDDKVLDHDATLDYRFDAFGVYGDVDNDAVIMAANANGWTAFRWNIKGGTWDGKLDIISLLPSDLFVSTAATNTDGVISWTLGNPGSAPQIFPIEGGLFYIDGNETFPMLFEAGTENLVAEGYFDSNLLDDFANCPTSVVVTNNEGEECTMNKGHNGLAEFQVGDEYFLVMAATNTIGSPTSAFALYKYKDAAKSFAEMEPMWFFPAKGMGAATNGCRTAVPYVEVKGTEANIYLYTNNNGYAAYTFTGKEGSGVDGVENIVEESFNKAQKVIENGVIYIYRNGVRYNVMGAEVK